MKVKNLFRIIIILFLIITVPAFAETTVISIKGKAQYKTGNQWATVTAGLKLADGTKISTGVNSEVVLNVNNNTVTIRQLSMIKIDESSLGKDESNIRLSLKRGGLNARVAKLKTLKTSFKISTPVATSSVRGTQKEIYYGPGLGMTIKIIDDGEVFAENKLGTGNLLRGRLEFRQENHKSSPNDISDNMRDGSRGRIFGNLTDEEKRYMQLSSDVIFVPDQPTSPLPSSQQGLGNVKITIIKP